MRCCQTVVRQRGKNGQYIGNAMRKCRTCKPWRNKELRRCEEALPRLREGDLEKASRMYKEKNRE